MKVKYIIICISVVFGVEMQAQTLRQIRGTVIDEASGEPIEFAAAVLTDVNPVVGTQTDSAGRFVLNNLPAGRYNLKISCLGYDPAIVAEILLTSAKDAVVEVRLKESVVSMQEVVVTPKVNKSAPLNAMTIASGRLLSVEEASRFAGGMDDPARLAAAFAGVSSDVGNNGIVVRGNAPKSLQWRMEDVEIPNPNHFAEVTTFGGGGLTSLSSNVLGNSDFFTGAFSAEYGNALSGVFDMQIRNGNNSRHEHTVQIGLIGIDLASEGPLARGYNGSYIFNYRYSTLSLLTPLLPEDAEGTEYQDLSFKFNLPTKRAGTFTVWGTGLKDASGAKAETDSLLWNYEQDKSSQDVRQYMGAAGIGHKISLKNNIYLKNTLAATVNGLNMHTERMDSAIQLIPQNVVKSCNSTFVFATSLNTKFNARHTNRTGVRFTGLHYNILTLNSVKAGEPLQTLNDNKGFSSLIAAYSSSSLRFSDKWTANIGVHAQYFILNGAYSVEPRIGLKRQLQQSHSLAFAYGLHSRLEMLNYYFVKSETGEILNQKLDFTRAHHFVLSYDYAFGSVYHFKAEPYVQYLYNVPVVAGTTFSFLNLKGGEDIFVANKLINSGKGLNYGLDLTFEKFISHGYYFLTTASVFNSQYQTTVNQWYNTRFNRNFVCNLLFGKEWQTGKKRQNIFSVNGRITFQGGDRYSPVDEALSAKIQDIAYNETQPYSRRFSPALLGHLTISYRHNSAHLSHEFAVKALNITGYKEYYGHRYNYRTGQVEAEREAVVMPNVSWRVEF
ncbi:MAG: carboxypeptidase-like regulatory domain-containing protein [Prevotellaceae bacterium]|nr:carboxypeptidase-like regulatory domain-containing protein [Prevotellaceae bacterium]